MKKRSKIDPGVDIYDLGFRVHCGPGQQEKESEPMRIEIVNPNLHLKLLESTERLFVRMGARKFTDLLVGS